MNKKIEIIKTTEKIEEKKIIFKSPHEFTIFASQKNKTTDATRYPHFIARQKQHTHR